MSDQTKKERRGKSHKEAFKIDGYVFLLTLKVTPGFICTLTRTLKHTHPHPRRQKCTSNCKLFPSLNDLSCVLSVFQQDLCSLFAEWCPLFMQIILGETGTGHISLLNFLSLFLPVCSSHLILCLGLLSLHLRLCLPGQCLYSVLLFLLNPFSFLSLCLFLFHFVSLYVMFCL